MSILELIVAGSLDSLLAAILWLLVERRCPYLVVAGPSNAGKSTTMEALLAFLPASDVIIPIQGNYDDFAFLRRGDPTKSCLVCAEVGFGWGMPWYLSGRKAVMFFECLRRGYNLATTLHADSAAETLAILRDYLEVPTDALARLGFIVSVSVGWRGRRIERWVSAVDVMGNREEGIGNSGNESPLAVVPVYRRRTPDVPAQDVLSDAVVADALARKVGMPAREFVREVKRREAYLAKLIAAGVRDYAAVREKITQLRP